MNSNWNKNRMRGGSNRGRGYGRGRSSGGFWPQRGFRGSRGYNRGGDRSNYDRMNFDGNNYNQQWTHKEKRNAPSKKLSEKDIGVTEYLSEHEGFNGIIKSRFSDFQVSEINEEGEVAKLTDLSPPEPPADIEVMEDEDLLNIYNLEILPMDTWDNINKISMATDNSVEPVKIDVTGMSKEDRTKIHDTVKKAFGESVVGSTITENDKKFVVFDKYRKGVRVDTRVKWVWPGEYVRFVLYKENCDTMVAAQRLAERLRLNIRPSMVGYAGTKDRRAKTSQWFSLRKVDPRKVAAACRDLRDIRVGNYRFSDTNLKLGMLSGNEFRICLRNVTASDECISRACDLLRQNGFINYYGLQRFGARLDMPTYEIGKRLLRADLGEAIEGIVSEHADALAAYRAHGARAALPLVTRASTAARVLAALAQRPRDLLAALDQIPRNTRLLYIHSYQSLIWNLVVSERLRKLPRTAAVGDLVPLEEIQDEEIDEETDEEENQSDSQIGDKSDNTNKDKTKNSKAEDEAKKVIPVKVLTQEDVDSGKYTIFDIVLPLPGHSVKYPPNMKEYYQELLEKDGLKMDLRHKYKSYRMCGGYRRCVLRPQSLSWSCARYSEPRADLLLSDRDRLEGVTCTGVQPDGKYKALLLTMSLTTSCYATMVLRELLRVDTSSDSQAQQNNYHQNNDSQENVDKDKDEGKDKDKDEGQDKDKDEGKDKDKDEDEDKVKDENKDKDDVSSGNKRKIDNGGDSDDCVKKAKDDNDE